MKQFFLSIATACLFSTAGFSQSEVEVFNNTGCDIDVNITSVDPSCTPVGGTIVVSTGLALTNPHRIAAFSSEVFDNTTAGASDFVVEVIVDPTGTANTLPQVQCDGFTACGLANAHAVPNVTPVPGCAGINNGFTVIAPPLMSPFFDVNVDPH